jgi:hypothetical protein
MKREAGCEGRSGGEGKQLAMTVFPAKGSKVFELFGGRSRGAEAGRRKLNVFARWVAC